VEEILNCRENEKRAERMTTRCTDDPDNTAQDSTSGLYTTRELALKSAAKSDYRSAKDPSKVIVAAHQATADPRDVSCCRMATSSAAHGGVEVVRSETKKNGRQGGGAGERWL
jgi:hypothetical protein